MAVDFGMGAEGVEVMVPHKMKHIYPRLIERLKTIEKVLRVGLKVFDKKIL